MFAPNSGCAAYCAPFIRNKSTTNCDAHLSESIFQTGSRREGRVFRWMALPFLLFIIGYKTVLCYNIQIISFSKKIRR
ncbi:DUF6783 domain-containing protein [uncultured Robinsoniella sp.]|uniref:DUF6783 domain-containing protein n=1 Tax=uncultured Robinsoniella sp. TaxID=904190 RepID=UPI00374FCB60